jgi:hypothetical protein
LGNQMGKEDLNNYDDGRKLELAYEIIEKKLV